MYDRPLREPGRVPGVRSSSHIPLFDFPIELCTDAASPFALLLELFLFGEGDVQVGPATPRHPTGEGLEIHAGLHKPLPPFRVPFRTKSFYFILLLKRAVQVRHRVCPLAGGFIAADF
eukprot:CAMPEP_0198200680 /NCGR_PEP_ID=MMETSP1445-20131203/3650_1 /TAXON_ID=36898 /ORGANISM="Pyramimonas sp., Strain CCMP2087" /LENGTH=117 /DNA_ID=CAMNT_0043870813 /DNA_START=1077 /DNA_END=1430 /DNA_ORIENTATION=-